MVGFKSAAAAALVATVASAAVVNTNTGMTFLYQNTLNLSDNYNHGSGLMLDGVLSYTDAQAACALVNETLITAAYLQNYQADFVAQIGYQQYQSYANSPQMFWISNGILQYKQGNAGLKFISLTKKNIGDNLPAICTQTRGSTNYGGSASSTNQVTIQGNNGVSYNGYRNQKAFRFFGIRYATNPGRFNYTSLYSPSNTVISALTAGAQSKQYGSGSEDCFFLNVFTPHIPMAGATTNLRAVQFFIHGGGFTSGAGSGYDGSDMATREDVVTVTINYRLGNYGFFAVPGYLPGNYGIGDQITALNWVVANIARFGGDPNRITITGQSAGAGSVRTLLGSPLAIGKFQGAVAVSNLGGGRTLGLGGNYGTTYSTYYTIAQSYSASNGPGIFTAAGCTQSTLAAQVACIYNTTVDLSNIAPTARYVVQDGAIVNTPNLQVATKGPTVANVPVIFGNAHDDGGSIGSGYSKTCTDIVSCLQANLYVSQAYAVSIVNSGLFPLVSTGNVTADSFNVTQRVATDITFRCVDQATMYAGATSGAFSKSYYYQATRGYPGDAYNPNGLNIAGTVSAAFPNGDPSTFYYKVHSSDLPNLFGTYYPPRAPSDIYALQLATAYFGSFFRTGDPNPPQALLKVRTYTNTAATLKAAGQWQEVSSENGPMTLLDYPAQQTTFADVQQCSFLNISSNFYFTPGAY